MINIIVNTREGEERALAAGEGLSLMEAIRDEGIDELLALCGGCCSCATCHVIVDAGSSVALAPISPDEDSLLDGSDHREENSRLACQIPLSQALDGLRLRIAPMD